MKKQKTIIDIKEFIKSQRIKTRGLKKLMVNILGYATIFIFLGQLVLGGTNLSEEVLAQDKKVIKIGFYPDDLFYYFDDNGKRMGYYYDLMELISKSTGIEYEYVDISLDSAIENLKNNEIDLVFGAGKTPEREKEFIYSKYYIGIDSMGVYTNDPNIKFGHIDALKGLTYGYINILSFQQFADILDSFDISVKREQVSSLDELSLMLKNNEIDFTLASSTDQKFQKFNKIYEISVGPVYMMSTKENEDVMKKIDSFFEDSTSREKIEDLYSSYFNDYKKQSEIYLLLFVLVFFTGIGFVIYKVIIKMENGVSCRQLKEQINNNQFIVYYQPIIDFKKHKIIACEALLRKKDGDKVLSPAFFLNDIYELDLMEEMTLWVLSQILKDFEEIKANTKDLDEEFYISMNVSFKELASSTFIDEVKRILKDVDLTKVKLCFEIVERYQLEDREFMNGIIAELRQLGIQIAIDDFGVEYSNLDILDKIEYDVIKLDKHFIDEIQSSQIRKETVLFIGRIIEHNNRKMVMEGVEYPEQLDSLIKLYPGSVYIQGYLYSPPIGIESIKTFTIPEIEVIENKKD
ncbi:MULTISPECIES: EAL domain-containing protein [unclassified Turicibacter]|uniref:EAL domain-containing protein n=2 Tax=Turicibacter TaxID=191303 RepID=UPI00137AACA2|nr:MULTISPECIES: EAL domain-containing protein [unclassified Turicibacter]MCU7203689.1 EAL domain-containing protein [Turicibacter sp. TA25]NCE78667.1 EAL domain-containing protein [Turicibacter sp. TS3]